MTYNKVHSKYHDEINSPCTYYAFICIQNFASTTKAKFLKHLGIKSVYAAGNSSENQTVVSDITCPPM